MTPEYEQTIANKVNFNVAAYEKSIKWWRDSHVEITWELESMRERLKRTGVAYVTQRMASLCFSFGVNASKMARSMSKECYDRSPVLALFSDDIRTANNRWQRYRGVDFSLTRREAYEPIMAPLLLLDEDAGVLQEHTPRKWRFVFRAGDKGSIPLLESWMENIPTDDYARATLLY